MVDGPAGKLPRYDGEGTVGFSIYNGAVSRWEKHDIPNLTACLAAYAPKVKLIWSDPRGDAAKQMGQVQSMLVQGINVLLDHAGGVDADQHRGGGEAAPASR